VTIFFPAIVEPEIPALPRTIHEDAAILVADKPAGLLVHPTHSCLRNNLIHLLRAEHPGVPLALAHRLDRDTSGLIVLTKTVEAARALAGQFERREIEKTYLAAVHGRMEPMQGTIDAPLGVARRLQVIFKRSTEGERAQHARTDFRVLGRGASASLVMLTPRTGRRHQLRAHLAAIGYPIAGDRLYALSDRDYLQHLRGHLREDARRLLLVLPQSEVAKVTFVQGDVTDLKALSAAIGTHQISHVIHLAGLQVPTCRADPHVPDELRRIARSDVPLPEATGNSTAARPAAFAAYAGRPEPAGPPISVRGAAKAPPAAAWL